MSPAVRFLVLSVLAWGGIRASALGIIPGAQLFSVEAKARAAPMPIAPTEFPPLEPVAAVAPDPAYAIIPAAYAPGAYYPAPAFPQASRANVATPYYDEADLPPPPRRTSFAQSEPEFFSRVPTLAEMATPQMASASWSPMRSTPRFEQARTAAALANRIDRLQLTAWALLRGTQGAISVPRGIAPAGTLGASQAGARLTYNFNRQLSATLRSSSTIGRRGGEVSAGLRVQPVTGIPLWITAERRQRIGRYGDGRNAFALFTEGGVYDRAMPLDFRLDAYLQAGVVGLRNRGRFIDGSATVTRPVYRNFSLGLGIWGGAQPGLHRLDAGPRLTMKVRDNMKVHFDYRQRIAGNAAPGSGPSVTLAGDF